MPLWVTATLAAAIFQTLRFMLQKSLSSGALSAGGATFSRFVYSAPFVLCGLALWLALTGTAMPGLTGRFWAFAVAGGTTQILATVFVVLTFRERNFAVGITFKKTEVIQTVLVGVLILGEGISAGALVAILLGLSGVLLLSRGTEARGLWRDLTGRAPLLGLGSGVLFAVSAVSYRGASLEIDAAAPLRAAVTLAVVVTLQTAVMGAWLAIRERGEIARVWAARRVAVWVGLTSLFGSFCWFLAFTLQTAAYVNALGQVEMIFSLLASVLFFRETVTRRETVGMALIAISVLTLILVI